MSGTERSMPEPLPIQTAARVLLTAIFFSHIFPIALAALLRTCGVKEHSGIAILVVGEIAFPLVTAGAMIHWLFRTKKCRYGFSWLSWQDWRTAICGWIAACAGSMVIGTLWKALLRRLSVNFSDCQIVLKFAENCSDFVFWCLFFLIVILTPLWEEIVFRRTLYSFLLPLGKWQSCILTALIFSALHFYLAGTPSLIFFGIVLQIIFLRTKNLAVPVIVHGAFNAVAMLGVHFLRG